jgi:hypothetical protein
MSRGAPEGRATVPIVKWRLEGRWIESCNCAPVALPAGMEYKTAEICTATVNKGAGAITYDVR